MLLSESSVATEFGIEVGRSGRQTGQAAIQNHGGVGMTEELPIRRYFKRITMIDMMRGNADCHLDRYRHLPG